jgi:hypothetical protein
MRENQRCVGQAETEPGAPRWIEHETPGEVEQRWEPDEGAVLGQGEALVQIDHMVRKQYVQGSADGGSEFSRQFARAREEGEPRQERKENRRIAQALNDVSHGYSHHGDEVEGMGICP